MIVETKFYSMAMHRKLNLNVVFSRLSLSHVLCGLFAITYNTSRGTAKRGCFAENHTIADSINK